MFFFVFCQFQTPSSWLGSWWNTCQFRNDSWRSCCRCLQENYQYFSEKFLWNPWESHYGNSRRSQRSHGSQNYKFSPGGKSTRSIKYTGQAVTILGCQSHFSQKLLSARKLFKSFDLSLDHFDLILEKHHWSVHCGKTRCEIFQSFASRFCRVIEFLLRGWESTYKIWVSLNFEFFYPIYEQKFVLHIHQIDASL